MEKVIYSKTIRHHARAKLAMEAAVVPPAKVETICRVATFNNNIIGEKVFQCRAVFYANTISLFLIDKLQLEPDDRKVVQEEHLLGKVNIHCVEAKSARISQYHRHLDTTSRMAPLKGKVVALCGKHPDVPLFQVNPRVLREQVLSLPKSYAALQAIPSLSHPLGEGKGGGEKKQKEKVVVVEEYRSSLTSSRGGNGNIISRSSRSSGVQEQSSSVYEGEGKGGGTRKFWWAFRGPATPTAGSSSSSSLVSIPTTQQQHEEEEKSSNKGDGKRENHTRNRSKTSSSSSELERQANLLLQARQLIIKFPTLRENERWLNLLNPTDQTRRWCKLFFHLPSSDVLHIFLARLYVENTKTSYLNDLAKVKVNHKIEQVTKTFPKLMAGTIISLDDLSFGTEFPVISNASDPTTSTKGEVTFGADVCYRGGLKMVIRIDVRLFDLPVGQVSYSCEIEELSGHVRVLVFPPPSERFFIGFLTMPELTLTVMRSTLNDVEYGLIPYVAKILPDLSVVVTRIAKESLFEDMICPLMNDFPFPVLGKEEEEEKKEEEEEENDNADGHDDDDDEEVEDETPVRRGGGN